MKRIPRETLVLACKVNAGLVVVLVLLVNFQAWTLARLDPRTPTFWDDDFWFAVYFLLGFAGNYAAFGSESRGRRVGFTSLGTLGYLTVSFGALAFCGHVLGIHYG